MSINFNDTTPAAPGGSTNVKWQNDSSGNASAYVTSTSLPAWLAALPDAPPSSAGTLDDEFLGASLDTVRWTWVNQGSVTASQSNSILKLFCPRASGDNKHMIVQTVPATPWEVTSKIWFFAPPSNYAQGGIILRNTAGQLVLFHYQYTQGLCMSYYNSPTSFNSTPFTFGQTGTPTTPLYFRIRDDGTNLTLSAALDGASFMQMNQVGRAAFLTGGATQAGIFLDTNETNFDVTLSSDWFRRTL